MKFHFHFFRYKSRDILMVDIFDFSDYPKSNHNVSSAENDINFEKLCSIKKLSIETLRILTFFSI